MESSTICSKLNESLDILNPLKIVKSIIRQNAKSAAILETIPDFQADLESLQNIYEQDDFKKAQNLLEKNIIRLDSLIRQTEKQEDKNQLCLFLGRIRTLEGLISQKLGGSQQALEFFEKAIALFSQCWSTVECDATSQDYRDYAISLHETGRTQEAINLVNEAVHQSIVTPELYMQLGVMLKQQEEYQEAEYIVKKGLKQAPSDPCIRQILAQLFEIQGRHSEASKAYQTTALLFSERDQLTPALDAINQAQKLAADNFQILSVKAEILSRLNRNEEALQNLNQALSYEPENTYLLFNKGSLLIALGQDEEAIKFLQQAVKIEPNLGWVYSKLGEKFRDVGRYEEALVALDQALKILPNDIKALASKGATLADLGRYKDALQVLDLALKGEHNYKFALAYKGIALRGLNQIDKAIAVLTTAVKLIPSIKWVKPELAKTLGEKGTRLRKEGKYREAIRRFQQAINYDPNLTHVYVQMLETLCNSGFYQEALELADRSLQQQEEASLLGIKGEILNILGQYQEAYDVLQRALKLAPNSAKIHFEISKSLHQRDLYEEELDWLDKAKSLETDQSLYSLILGFKGAVLRRLGDHEKAEQVLKQSVAINKNLEIPRESLDIGFDYAWIVVELAKILQCLGRNQQAIEEYRKAQEILNQVLELTKGNEILKAKVLGKQGQIFRVLGEYSQAIEVLLDSIAIQENALWVHAELGEIYRLLGQYEYAIEELDKALTINPNNTQAIGSKGAILAVKGQYKDALQVLSQAETKPQPDYEFVLKIKTEILYKIAEYKTAAQIVEKLSCLNPYDSWVFRFKGWVLLQLGSNRIQDAEDAYNKAIKIDPENLWGHKGIAEILYLRGNLQECREKYKWILWQIDQTKDFDYWLMGWCYYRLGQYSKAANYLNQAFTSCITDDEACTLQFDVSLALMCSKRYELALQEYETGLQILDKLNELNEQSPLRGCGLLSIALLDLRDAINQPHLKLSQVPEAQKALKLLEKAFSEAESFKSENLQLF